MSKIAILGAGVYGTALGGILASNGYDIDYYDPLKERESLKNVVSNAKMMVLVVPSDTAMKLLSHLPKDVPLVVAAKGFLSEQPFADFKKWDVLSGAGFAEDLKNGNIVHLTVTDRNLAEFFNAPHLVFDYTDDKRGVLICGALKNVYALLAGKLGLKFTSLRMPEFIMQASNEISMILKANDAKFNTIRLSCGVKDLIITCSPKSRNYSYGLSLFNHTLEKPKGTIEGLATIKRIKRGELIVPHSAKILNEFLMEEVECN